MSNNYDDYDYEDSNNTGLGKKILIIVLVIITIILVILLLRSCGKGSGGETKPNNNTETAFNYENDLLEAGKKYYENNEGEYPTSVGECTYVDLQKLIEKGLVNPDNYNECNVGNTYVRVCILENGTRQYTPWLTCRNKDSESEYETSRVGTLSDVIQNSTYVEFKFLPEYLKSEGAKLGAVEELWKSDIKYENYKTLATTTYYRYRDKLFTWNVKANYYYTTKGEKANAKDVNEYYTISPNSNYPLYDNKTTDAYKWYTTTSGKVYALTSNGKKARSDKAIGDYNVRDDESGISVTMYISRQKTTQSYSPTLYYQCAKSASDTKVVINQKNVECGKGADKSFGYQVKKFYSCAQTDSDSVVGMEVSSASSKCYKYTEWSDPTQTKCDVTKSDLCKSVTAYFYNWYKIDKNAVRTYIPSGSSSAKGEKTYYTSAPVEGAIRDELTKSTAYKWFRSVNKTTTDYTAVAPAGYSSATKTSNYKYSDWSTWSTKNPKASDGRVREIENKVKVKLQPITGAATKNWTKISEDYLTESEMIEMYNYSNYAVSTLEDIQANDEIRYSIKMFIRNKKEAN